MLRAMTFGLLALPASAALADGHAIGLKVGAFGLGAEYTHELTDRIALRGALYGSNSASTPRNPASTTKPTSSGTR